MALTTSFINSVLYHIKLSYRRPMVRFVLIAQPLFFVTLSWFILKEKESSTGIMVAQFILSGGLTTFWTGIVFTSAGDIDREKNLGTLEHLICAPLGFKRVMISKILGNMVLCFAPLVFISLSTVVFYQYFIIFENLVKITLSFTILCSNFLLISLLLSGFFVLSQQSVVLTNAFEYPFFFLCGFVFPIESMPYWLQKISYLIPLTYLIQLFRISLYEMTGKEIWEELLLSSIICTLSIALITVFVFHRLDKAIKVTGQLNME